MKNKYSLTAILLSTSIILSSCGGTSSSSIHIEEPITDTPIEEPITDTPDEEPSVPSGVFSLLGSHETSGDDEVIISRQNESNSKTSAVASAPQTAEPEITIHMNGRTLTLDTDFEWIIEEGDNGELIGAEYSEWIENVRLDGESVLVIGGAPHAGDGQTLGAYGVIQTNEGDYIAFHSSVINSNLSLSDEVTTYDEHGGFTSGFANWYEPVASSHSISNVRYEYLVVQDDGSYQTYQGNNGTIDFDQNSGVWEADIGEVDLLGAVDGVSVSGTATLGDMEGYFNGFEAIHYEEYYTNGELDYENTNVISQGAFSGVSDDEGFAGTYVGYEGLN